MAITDTLTAIKEMFKEWHTTYYTQLHTKITDTIADLNKSTLTPEEGSQLVSHKGIWEALKSVKNNLTNNLSNHSNNYSDCSHNGHLRVTDFKNFYNGSNRTSYMIDYFQSGGHAIWYRQGRMCICNIRGVNIASGLQTNKYYVRFGIPKPEYKPIGNFVGTATYDEVKWVAVVGPDSYNPEKVNGQWHGAYRYDTKEHLSQTALKQQYPNGAITFKPLYSDSSHKLYGTIVYYCAGNQC